MKPMMTFYHAAHALSGHAHRHPVTCAGEALLAAGLIALLTGMMLSSALDRAADPLAAPGPAVVEKAQATPEKSGWVWKKRVSHDNNLYAFGRN